MSNYENVVMLRCNETGDFDAVPVLEFNPRVNLGVEILTGTRYCKKITLQYDHKTDDYRTEAFGRNFMSRGPKLKEEPKKLIKKPFKR